MSENPKPTTDLVETRTATLEHQDDANTLTSLSLTWEYTDRQYEDQPNRGFSIARIERDTPPEPVPVEAALPLAFPNRRTQEARNTLVVDTLTDKLADGTVELKPVEDMYKTPVNGLTLTLDFAVNKQDYDAAIAEGRVKPGLFDEHMRIGPANIDAQALLQIVDPNQKRQVVNQAVARKVSNARSSFVNDLEDLNSVELADVHELTEAYDLEDRDQTVRLLNMSGVPMADEHVRRAINAVRSTSDKSGGGVYDRLQTIAILPEEHPALSVQVTREDGQKDTIPAGGLQRGKTIFLSGRLLKNPADRTPLPAPAPGKSLFDRYGLPGEVAEGPGSPRKSVGAQDFEPTLVHELEHAALPSQYHGEVPGPAPSLYGRSNTDEHLSEVAAATYMGGDYASEVPNEQRAAVQQMWNAYRGVNKNVYDQPVGPHYVQCRELDISGGPLPLRVDKRGRQVVAEISYHLETEQDTQADVMTRIGSTALDLANHS